MHRRLLTVLAVASFVLTLLCASAVGAQESTDTSTSGSVDGGAAGATEEIQAQGSQQQRQVALRAEGCRDPRRVGTFSGNQDRSTPGFDIDGEAFRISYQTEPIDDQESASVDVRVLDEDNRHTGVGFVALDGEDGSGNILEGPGEFRLWILADNAEYHITVYDCRGNEPDDAGTSDTSSTSDDTSQVAQTTSEETDATETTDTTAGVTTSGADTTGTTAGVTAVEEDTSSDGGALRTDADAFRCEELLRVFRSSGNRQVSGSSGDRQYNDSDAVVTQRVETCLAAEVDRDTIPKGGSLPFTGGPYSLGLAAIGLACVVAGASVLRAGIRRRG